MNPIIEYHRIAGSLTSDKLHSLNAYLVGAYLILSPEHWESAINTVREFMPLSVPAEDEAAPAASGEDRPTNPYEVLGVKANHHQGQAWSEDCPTASARQR